MNIDRELLGEKHLTGRCQYYLVSWPWKVSWLHSSTASSTIICSVLKHQVAHDWDTAGIPAHWNHNEPTGTFWVPGKTCCVSPLPYFWVSGEGPWSIHGYRIEVDKVSKSTELRWISSRNQRYSNPKTLHGRSDRKGRGKLNKGREQIPKGRT